MLARKNTVGKGKWPCHLVMLNKREMAISVGCVK